MISSLSLFSCKSSIKKYELAQSKECISNIYIVKIEDSIIDSFVLAEIEDREEFLMEFSEINFRTWGPGARPSLYEEIYAIKILYNNNDSEYIGYNAQNRYVADKEYCMIHHCDKMEFYKFITKYYQIEI